MKRGLILFISTLAVSIILVISCSDNKEIEKIPVKIIFDTDMGSDCDDVGALALLNKYADMEKAQIVACIYSSGKVPYGAGIIDAINRWYGRPDIPIGAYHDTEVGDPVDKMTAEKLAMDTTAFGNKIILNTDCEEQTTLTRRVLWQQPDSSVIYLTLGHTKALYQLLVSSADDVCPLSGIELIKLKVSRWVALGALGAANDEGYYVKDWNFFFNNTSSYSHYLIENFPAPVYYVDAGTNVITGRSLQDTPPGNIVRTAYRDWLWEVFKKPLQEGRPSWDLAALYFAVEGNGKYLRTSASGYLEFNEQLGCRWIESENTCQWFVQQLPDSDEGFSAFLEEMISMEPLYQ